MDNITFVGCLICSLIIIGFVYLGCLYIKDVKLETSASNQEKLLNKQKYVKQHRNIFGVSEHESNDIKHVYTVSPERMGL